MANKNQIVAVLAGNQALTWEAVLAMPLKEARSNAQSLGLRPKDVELAWLKHKERSRRERTVECVPALRRWRAKEVRRSYDRCSYRTAMHSHEVELQVGEPRAASESGQARPSAVGLPNVYSKRGFWVATSQHWINYPERWLSRVKMRGAAVVDSRLTLDLATEPESGTQAYQAVWVEQGRGTTLKTVQGWMMQTSYGGWKHVRSLRAAKRAA